MPRSWSEQPVLAAVLAIFMYCIYYFVICQLPVFGIPTFRIDYSVATVTTAGNDPLALLVGARPVAEIYLYVQSLVAKHLFNGQGKYIIYPLQHIALLIYFISIAKVIESILNFKFNIFSILGAWLLFVVNPGAIEGVYKLETIVGTLSMLFGGVALMYLVNWDRDKQRSSAIFFILFYALSLFSKEDFILPPLVLLGWYLVRNNDWQQEVHKYKEILIATFSVLFLFLIFNKFIIAHRSYMDPVQQSGHPYFMSLNPVSVLNVVYYYLTGFYRHIKILTVLYVASSFIAIMMMRSRIKEILVIVLIVLCLMAPYSIMPNHLFSYYGLKWWAWQTLTTLALAQLILASRSVLATALLSSIILVFAYKTTDRNVSNYFRTNFAISNNMQISLSMNRELINAQKKVAVIGIGPGQISNSPWQGNGETEFYLRNDLNTDTQWIVFVESGDDRYVIDNRQQPNFYVNKKVIVLDRKELEGFGTVPQFVFSPDGQGRFK